MARLIFVRTLLAAVGLARLAFALPPLGEDAAAAARTDRERPGNSTAALTAESESRRPARRPVLVESTQSPFERAFIPDPRVRPLAGDLELLRLQVHGQYGISYTRVPSLRLSTYGFADYRDELGQSRRLEHTLRLSPRVSYRRSFSVIAQFDLPTGMLYGQPTAQVQSDPLPLDEEQPMHFVPRWLYVDIALKSGSVLIGQQPAAWGLGLIDHSGDERQFFGDSRLGSVVDRVAYRGRPLGPRHPWELLVATDWVFADGRVDTARGDRSIRYVVANSYVVDRTHRVGLLVSAERVSPHFADAALQETSPKETRLSFDLALQTEAALRGINVRFFAAAELAWITGRTDLAAELTHPNNVAIQRLGAVARVGMMQTSGNNRIATGPLGVALEWGYASGDADPGDGVDRRFTMNPSRRVGLILFDETLRWKTARSAVALDDSRLGYRQTASGWGLASAGAVTGAAYVMPQILYRPHPKLDVRGAVLVAQSTADQVDPTWLLTQGRYANYDGGDVSHRDLGLELDAAVEYRHPLAHGLATSVGLEGGLLFPGKAFDDSAGNALARQGLVRGRFGFYF